MKICIKKGLYKNVFSSHITNNLKLETSLMSISRLGGGVFTQWNTTEQWRRTNTAPHNTTDAAQKHHVKQKPDVKECICITPVTWIYKTQEHTQNTCVKTNSKRACLEEGGEVDRSYLGRDTKELSGGRKCLILFGVVVRGVYTIGKFIELNTQDPCAWLCIIYDSIKTYVIKMYKHILWESEIHRKENMRTQTQGLTS